MIDALLPALGALLLVPIAYAACSLAPWVPTAKRDFERIDDCLDLKANSRFYEIGCGEGRVCRYIAAKNPDAQVIGIEMALPLYLLARLRNHLSPINNLTYVYGNALTMNLSDADAVYTYATIKTLNEKLMPKLISDLQQGSKVVSYHFAVKDWKGKMHVSQPTERDAALYIYRL